MIELEEKDSVREILNHAYATSKKESSEKERVEVLCDITKIFGKLDEKKRAEKILHKALGRFEHISFSVDQKARALADINRTMAKIGEVDEALSLAENLSNKYGRAAASAIIADELIGEGRGEEANDISEKDRKGNHYKVLPVSI